MELSGKLFERLIELANRTLKNLTNLFDTNH
jgi:hypothetical protein